jgi:hypothetical protein
MEELLAIYNRDPWGGEVPYERSYDGKQYGELLHPIVAMQSDRAVRLLVDRALRLGGTSTYARTACALLAIRRPSATEGLIHLTRRGDRFDTQAAADILALVERGELGYVWNGKEPRGDVADMGGFYDDELATIPREGHDPGEQFTLDNIRRSWTVGLSIDAAMTSVLVYIGDVTREKHAAFPSWSASGVRFVLGERIASPYRPTPIVSIHGSTDEVILRSLRRRVDVPVVCEDDLSL